MRSTVSFVPRQQSFVLFPLLKHACFGRGKSEYRPSFFGRQSRFAPISGRQKPKAILLRVSALFFAFRLVFVSYRACLSNAGAGPRLGVNASGSPLGPDGATRVVSLASLTCF
jgi:hypothetical protein